MHCGRRIIVRPYRKSNAVLMSANNIWNNPCMTENMQIYTIRLWYVVQIVCLHLCLTKNWGLLLLAGPTGSAMYPSSVATRSTLSLQTRQGISYMKLVILQTVVPTLRVDTAILQRSTRKLQHEQGWGRLQIAVLPHTNTGAAFSGEGDLKHTTPWGLPAGTQRQPRTNVVVSWRRRLEQTRSWMRMSSKKTTWTMKTSLWTIVTFEP